ncbi:MAG: M48 family metallopeptidase [Magnetococcus sp. WYHC-3]
MTPRFHGDYFDGVSSRAHHAVLELGADGSRTLHLPGGSVRRLPPDDGHLEYSPDSSLFSLRLGDGACFQCRDDPRLHAWMTSQGQGRTRRMLAWLESHRSGVLVSGILVALFIAWVVYYGIPLATHVVVQRLPAELDRHLGVHVLALLEQSETLRPSGLDPDTRQRYQTLFAQVTSGMPQRDGLVYRLQFRFAPHLGANALALPSGDIVVTDDLVQRIQDPREFQILLAHELGHVYLRHSVQSGVRKGLVSLLVALLAGDSSSLMDDLLTALPVLLTQAGYSRQFEEQADAFALDFCRRQGLPGAPFALLLERLDPPTPGKNTPLNAYLETHPATPERAQRFRDLPAR